MKQYTIDTPNGEMRVTVEYIDNEWVAKVYDEDEEQIGYTRFSKQPNLDDVNDALYLW